MLSKLVWALIVLVVATLVFYLIGGLLLRLEPVAGIGAFLVNECLLLGLLVGLLSLLSDNPLTSRF